MRIETSWDDGTKTDIRLAELLLKYDIPAIFFIPSNHELTIEQIKWLDKSGFEIGGHTVHHFHDLKLRPTDVIFHEIYDNKLDLEQILGKELRWFCYPRGRHSDQTDLLVEGCGYKYARTTVVGVTDARPSFVKHTSVHVFDGREEYKPESDWLEYAKRIFLEARNRGAGVFHLWGHSREVEKWSQWSRLEEFFIWMKANCFNDEA